jgi:hypothetical protein
LLNTQEWVVSRLSSLPISFTAAALSRYRCYEQIEKPAFVVNRAPGSAGLA